MCRIWTGRQLGRSCNAPWEHESSEAARYTTFSRVIWGTVRGGGPGELGRKGGGRERGKSEGIAGEENESFLFMGPVVVSVPKIPPTLFPLFTQAWKALITVKVEYAVLSF